MDLKELIKSKTYFIFDLDGTLVDLEDLNFNSFEYVVNKFLKIPFSYDLYLKYFSGAGSQKGFEEFIKSENIKTDLEIVFLVEEFKSIKKDQLNENFENSVKLKNGALEFLQYLKTNNKKIALATSSSYDFATLIMKSFKLTEYFDSIVTIRDIKNSKPNPEIFLTAMNKLNGNISDSIIFEDSKIGVEGAKRSMIDYVIIHTKGRNDSVITNEKYVITDFRI
jgi:HAD superfamily hydrolase (TIGR01509 family)